MNIYFIGYLGTIFSALSILPNVYNAVVKKKTVCFSYFYMILGLIAQICWFIFAIFTKNIPHLIISIYLFICYILIILYKKYHEKNKDLY